jgi:hypothetical protein
MNRPRTYAYPTSPGQTIAQQADDESTCESWARWQTGYDATGNTVTGAVGGALLGASIGALMGAIICAPIKASGSCAAMGAAVGGAQGGVQGATAGLIGGREEFSQAYGACMSARGYATAGAYNAFPPVAAPPPMPQPTEAPEWCRGENQEWLGVACLTRAKGGQ